MSVRDGPSSQAGAPDAWFRRGRPRPDDNALRDRKPLFDPDEVGENLVGGLIAVSFFFLEAAKDELC